MFQGDDMNFTQENTSSGRTSHAFSPSLPKVDPGFALMESCKFKIRTVEEAARLAGFAAGMFRDPERVRSGLFELLLNAVEHGVLGIGHTLKTRLLATRSWQLEISRRQSLPENRQKHVDVVVARRTDGIYIVITDPGPGFDWKPWISLDPARAAETHGGGIARAANLSFDSLKFNDSGNQVALYSKDTIDIPW